MIYKGRKLKVLCRDEQSKMTLVYGWRDVVAWWLFDEDYYGS